LDRAFGIAVKLSPIPAQLPSIAFQFLVVLSNLALVSNDLFTILVNFLQVLGDLGFARTAFEVAVEFVFVPNQLSSVAPKLPSIAMNLAPILSLLSAIAADLSAVVVQLMLFRRGNLTFVG
jgi:hypothetical protein